MTTDTSKCPICGWRAKRTKWGNDSSFTTICTRCKYVFEQHDLELHAYVGREHPTCPTCGLDLTDGRCGYCEQKEEEMKP